MKRLLRYMLYREVYRQLRKAFRSASSSDDSEPVEPDKRVPTHGSAASSGVDAAGLPADGTTLDDPAQLQAVLQRMDAYDFEHFVADLWERMGWETEVSAEVADKGVDVVARKQHPYEQTTLIQAKRYGPNTTVGSPEVQQYASLKNQYSGVDKVVIVTTNEFTGQARELAERLNVKLVNGRDLVALIEDAEAADLVAKYLDFIEVVEKETGSEPGDASDPEAGSKVGTEADSSASAGANEKTATETTETTGSPSARWHGAIAAATVGWLVIVADGGPQLLPDALWGLIFLVSWILLPVAIYKDAASIPDEAGWPGYTRAYLIGSLVWVLALIVGVIYLWRRRRALSTVQLPSEQGAAAESPPVESSAAESPPAETSPVDTGGDPDTSTETGEADPSENIGETHDHGMEHHVTQDEDRRRTIGYKDGRYACVLRRSPDGAWAVAYGRRVDADQHRLFVYDEEGLRFSEPITNPIGAAIANTGRTIAIDGLDPDEQAGRAVVFDPDGEELFTHYLNADVADCAITPDGRVAAAATHEPDHRAYLFDVDEGRRRATHEHPREYERSDGRERTLAFEEVDGGWQLVLAVDADGEPRYVIDLDGTVVREEPLPSDEADIDRLLDSDDPSDLRTAIDRLRERYETVDDDHDRKAVARQLADAHWSLARKIDGTASATVEEGDYHPAEADEHLLDHLDRAQELYFELLPWYDGKAGVAKVLRKRGRYHLERDERQRAYECFREIERLADEYDVDLLTAGDERRLAELAEEVDV